MYILDTDTLSRFFAGEPKIVERANGALELVATTVISQAEMLRGRSEYLLKADSRDRLLRAQASFQRTLRQVSDFVAFGLDDSALEHSIGCGKPRKPAR